MYLCIPFDSLKLFPGAFFHCKMTGSCSVTTDLIMRVSVGTTTTEPTMRGESGEHYNMYRPRSDFEQPLGSDAVMQSMAGVSTKSVRTCVATGGNTLGG